MPELRITRRARELIAALAPELQDAVESTLLRLQADPGAAGKPLQGRLRGIWVARVGSYRILYTIEGAGQSLTVVVRAVLHRSGAVSKRGVTTRP